MSMVGGLSSSQRQRLLGYMFRVTSITEHLTHATWALEMVRDAVNFACRHIPRGAGGEQGAMVGDAIYRYLKDT